MSYSKISIFLILSAIMLPPLFGKPVVAQSSTSGDKIPANTKRPAPPRRIPPNKVKPGGGLDPSYQACENDKSSLTALIPVNNPVLTAQSHPSFLFYISDKATAIDYGEFSLFTASEKTRIYSTKIDLKNTPGIIKINLPNASEYALEMDRSYHWYFRVYCQTETDNPRFLDVDGWIERVSITPTTDKQTETASPYI